METLLNSPELSAVRTKLGGNFTSWTIDEIGDGNVNMIFRVQGPAGQVLIKQAVPYLRCVGESWPLSTRRSFFEYSAFYEHSKVAQKFLPDIYYFDANSALLVMEFLQDKIILRKGLMLGQKYDGFAADIGEYMAHTLFFTSDLFLSAAEKKEKVKTFCDNVDLCKITEDLIFTDPYRNSEQNRWTSPQLDHVVEEFHRDVELQLAVTALKNKFLTATEALIHGDLHTGSIMVDSESTKVIDPEFAFYGPMGFDIGLLLGNILLSYFSQNGYGPERGGPVEKGSGPRREEEGVPYSVRRRRSNEGDDPFSTGPGDFEAWLLQQFESIWKNFSQEFAKLWDTNLRGDLLSAKLLKGPSGPALVRAYRQKYLTELFKDSLGFAGAEMIRRILGLAHVADLESLSDEKIRARCEHRALRMAYQLIVHRSQWQTPADVTALARQFRTLQLHT